jgi:hypothetical protein
MSDKNNDDMPQVPDLGNSLQGAIIEMLSSFASGIEPIVDAAAGYKKMMEAQGFSGPSAELAALEYHGLLMKVIISQLFATKSA